MQRWFSILLVSTLLVLATGAIFSFNHGAPHRSLDCVSTLMNQVDCPMRLGVFGSALFHVQFLKSILTGISDPNFLVGLIILLVLFWLFAPLAIFRSETIFSARPIFSLTSTQKIWQWLRLHETSPTV